jgi:hypothetical protein
MDFKVSKAEEWLINCRYNEWISIKSIPDSLIFDVINIIDEWKSIIYNDFFDEFKITTA